MAGVAGLCGALNVRRRGLDEVEEFIPTTSLWDGGEGRRWRARAPKSCTRAVAPHGAARS